MCAAHVGNGALSGRTDGVDGLDAIASALANLDGDDLLDERTRL
jgi:hypothetical protein